MLKNRSLSFKLVLLFLLTGVAMIVILRLLSGGAFVKQFRETIHPHLYQYFHYINAEIGTPPNLETAKRLSDSLKVKIIIRGPEIRWSSDGEFPQKHLFRFRPHHNQGKHYKSGFYKRHFVIRIPNAPYHTTFITQNDSDLLSPWKLLLSTLLGVLFVLGLLYFLLRRLISPLKDIQKSVKKIGSGELDHRIPIKRKDELGELSIEINAMADDVENMLEAKRQLLLAISHELRSPITRAKVALSLMDEGNLKNGLEDDLSEMETMISGLLEAEQLNHRHQALNLREVNINSLISGVVKKHFSDEAIKQRLGENLSTKTVDEVRIQFVIKNLLSNALKYRKNNSDEITITTKQTDRDWTIVVEDQGIGIPEEHIPHLSEPFYRVDPSRHRETGGYGLGLYIIKRIVEAHQGNLTIESNNGVGTKVIVRLPKL